MKVAIDSRKQNDYDKLLEFIDNSAKKYCNRYNCEW